MTWLHGGPVWRIIVEISAVLFCVVKVMGSSVRYEIISNWSRMVNVSFLCNAKLKSALDWSGIIERNQNYFVSSSSSAVAQKQVTIHEQGGRRNGLAYIGFPGLFLLFLPPSGQCMAGLSSWFVFFPPQNSNVAGSAKWAQIRKMPNYSIIRRTNWIFSFATTTWYICLLAYTVKNVSVIVKHYGTTYPNSPLSVWCS